MWGIRSISNSPHSLAIMLRGNIRLRVEQSVPNRNTLFENCLFVKNSAIGGLGQPSGTWENARGGAIYSGGGWSDTGVITVVANCTFDSNYVEVLTEFWLTGWI